MDPNETLREMRELVQGVFTDGEATTDREERLAELFDALDGWLKNGGFLPQGWERGVRR